MRTCGERNLMERKATSQRPWQSSGHTPTDCAEWQAIGENHIAGWYSRGETRSSCM